MLKKNDNIPCCSAGTVLLSLLLEDRLELLELPEGAVGAPGSRSLQEMTISCRQSKNFRSMDDENLGNFW